MNSKTRVVKAFLAMKDLDIPLDKVKPVLKNLLNLYDNDWSLIEAENYRALVDAIFESEEVSATEQPKSSSDTQAAAEPCLKVVNAQSEDEVEEEETEALAHPLKRSRHLYREGQSSILQTCSNGETQALLVWPNEEPGKLPEPLPHKLNGSQAIVQSPDPNATNTMVESPSGTYPSPGKGQGKQPKQESSTTALIENNDMAMTEDVPLLEASFAIFCPDISSTIASLNAKHGAIDKDCNLSSNWMKKLILFGICGLLKQLENKKLDELDISSLSPYYNIVWDAES